MDTRIAVGGMAEAIAQAGMFYVGFHDIGANDIDVNDIDVNYREMTFARRRHAPWPRKCRPAGGR